MLADLVFQSLDDVRPAGTFVDVVVAQVVLQSVQLSLSFNTSANVDTTALAARAAVVNYVNGLAPGIALTVEGILTVLRSIQGLVVTGSEVVSPAGTITPERLQVFRTLLSMVSTVSTNPNRAIQSSLNPDSLV